MLRTLGDRVAVVTGAASGIGLALARALDSQGARLELVDVDERVLEVAAGFGDAVAHVFDVSDARALEGLAREVEARRGGAQLLINNAGVSVAGGFEAVPQTDFEWLFNINFWGVVNGCRAFLPQLRAQPEAHIVNVCSSFAWLGFPGKSAYASSKAALKAFTESIRAELSSTSVGVTLLFPGPVDTNLVRRGRAVNTEQRAAESDFLAQRGVADTRVAKQCLKGVRRNSARVVVSLDYHALDLAVRLSPTLALRGVTALSRKLPF